MDARLFVAIAVVLVVGLIGTAVIMGEPDPPTPRPAAVPILPGPDELRLEPGFSAAGIASSAIGSDATGIAKTATSGGVGGSVVKTGFEGMWVQKSGWRGEVLGVKYADGVTRISFDASEHTTPGRVWVIVNVPGDPGKIKRGDWVRCDGRIAQVLPSQDLMTTGHRVELDRATVLEHRNAN